MKKILALLLCLMLPLSAAFADEHADAPLLEVHQMPIGYADGYYIRCGDIEIMIDGGKPVPFARNEDVLNCLRELGAERLDAYIITHWHLDHCENFNPVLAEFGTPETAVYSPSTELPDRITHQKGELQIAPMVTGVYSQMKTGDVITLGALTITCVGPENGGRTGKSNPDSLNFVLQYGSRRMLFTGDYASSRAINTEFSALCSHVDVLKFPHHGGEPFQITAAAVRTVSPAYVLMPSNLNNYKVFTFLRDNGVEIQREQVLSQREGHVVILTDGGDYIEAKTNQNPADYAPKAN